jgi:hypothetical protein
MERVDQSPQEVADLIYTCATTDMPTVNPCGQDARRFSALREHYGHNGFLDELAALLTPNEL